MSDVLSGATSLCLADECRREVFASGLCSTHYQRNWLARHPNYMRDYMRQYSRKHRKPRLCRECGKPAQDVKRRLLCAEHLRKHDETRSVRVHEKAAAWYRANSEGERLRVRNNHMKRKYGLSYDDVTAWWVASGQVCHLCCARIEREKVYVDHDHVTGVVRGLLCSGCNAGLGLLGDTTDGLLRALSYLGRAK